MDSIEELFYECGTRYFESERYEEAVLNWVRAYDLNYERESIIENIYNCFIQPNEQEFRKNYEQNGEGFTQVPFEACALDFIPLGENKFYIFDREEKIFRGIITLEEEPLRGAKVEFSDILYTDTWDIREILPDMKENLRDVVYILLGELESKFVSFFKLPGFRELYLGNVITFADEELMREFFEQYEEFYLPKEIVTTDAEKYWKLIHDIHEKRICHVDIERKNIFLSICIPSYNRGKIALENVRHLLSCPYDSEIEIIVSNNGSTKGMEEYDAIKNIEDSRIRYHKFAENQGYAANILKVCSMAKGKYALLVSDEDLMLLENLGKFLNAVRENSNCGAIFVGKGDGILNWKAEEDGTIEVTEQGIRASGPAGHWAYISGFAYNMELCRRLNALEILEKLRVGGGYSVDWRDENDMRNNTRERNLCVEIYTHNCLAMMLCRYADFVWIKVEMFDTVKNHIKPEKKFPVGVRPECRIELQNSRMDFAHQVLNLSKIDLIDMFIFECKRVHGQISLAFKFYPKNMLEIGSEWEVQAWVCREQIKYLDSFPISLTEKEYSLIREKLSRAE